MSCSALNHGQRTAHKDFLSLLIFTSRRSVASAFGGLMLTDAIATGNQFGGGAGSVNNGEK